MQRRNLKFSFAVHIMYVITLANRDPRAHGVFGVVTSHFLGIQVASRQISLENKQISWN